MFAYAWITFITERPPSVNMPVHPFTKTLSSSPNNSCVCDICACIRDMLVITVFVQVMMLVQAECLQLPFVFDGNVATLPGASPGGERCVSTPFLTSVSGKRLFFVSVRTDTAGGRRGAGHDCARETLCVMFIKKLQICFLRNITG